MKRITIIAGHYGSGKSEISTNLAFQKGIDTIVDLDIINPYFRSRALTAEFEERGIHVIESTIKGKLNSDMPYVSGEAAVPFVNPTIRAIYDLGGTKNGGRVLIQFRDRIKTTDDIDFLYVVNKYRPENDSAKKVINAIKELESEAQLNVTGLINNTNLMQHTTVEDILDGETLCNEVSDTLHIPIVYTTVEKTTGITRSFAGETIIIERLVAQKWL
ncbi:ATP-binding protein [Candidatus Xianfuyuplasma coldseepsis]|uniref:ATP-binding protein n=1 Tax=Candidatus Xianfuyuplasma coldseepsis TaxID=2782163 RepID=A0A7L7KP56_9MOLU|nr:ATP-binding protein [Xianfuyuplasma coldseepsis]QMS84315.1 ATP-binding protein [Xianfuyuplasma coldseepsis]